MDRSRDFQPAAYMVANHKGGTIYVGVTSNLPKRTFEHRQGLIDGFSRRYSCKRLVRFECHSTMEHAIDREKQLKAGSRKRKVTLIEGENPDWRDLFFDIAQ